MIGPLTNIIYGWLKNGPFVYAMIAATEMYFGVDTSSIMVMVALQGWTAFTSLRTDVPTYRQPTRRWGPLRQEYYSICSAHYRYDTNCRTCGAGSWRNIYVTALSQIVYRLFPKAWRWWVNTVPPKFYRLLHRMGLH